MTFNSSPLCGIPFMGQKSFFRFSLVRRSFTGLLWLGDVLHVFYSRRTFVGSSIARKAFKIFSSKKTQVSCSRKTFYGSSIDKEPFKNLLQLEDFLQVSYSQMSFYRSSLVRRPFTDFHFPGLLQPENRPQVGHFIGLLQPEGLLGRRLLQVSKSQMTIYRSAMSEDLL